MLDSVPAHGRIFLERDETGRVAVGPAFRDVVQDALNGRSGDALNLLREDDAAEGVLHGVFDDLLPRQRIRRESIRIGRDTGTEEFPAHATAFRKFGRIQHFVFVLDGDKRDSAVERRIQEGAGVDVPVLFLPGREAPEIWIWGALRRNANAAAAELGFAPSDLAGSMARLDSVYDSASDRPAEIAKSKLRSLSDLLSWSVPDVCRVVARLETRHKESDIQPLVEGLQNAVTQWRAE